MYNFEINKNYVNYDQYGREFVFTVLDIIDTKNIRVLNQDTKDILVCSISELKQAKEIKAYLNIDFKFLFALRFFLKDELQKEYDLNEMDELFVDLFDIGLYTSVYHIEDKEFEFQYSCNLETMSCVMEVENMVYSVQSFNSIDSLSEYIENLSLEKIFNLFDEDKLQDLVQKGILEER